MKRFFGVLAPSDAGTRGAGTTLDAPARIERDGVIVALVGRPFWRGRPEAPADEAMAGRILDAFRERGSRVLEDLHGSFALAILEPGERRALLAIDRMGIQRLAYRQTREGLCFSTSAEAVARHASASPAVDLQAVFDYLFFHMVPSPRTLFAGVGKLPPATCAEYADGRLTLRPYWNPTFVEDGPGDAPALARELHESLRTGVLAAAPGSTSGAFLSGGLDSSTVAGVLT